MKYNASLDVLAMALHELATNAVKYGGLSTEEGRIEVRWALEDGRFQFSWLEKGGPPVTAPSQTGFGTVLISRVLQAETRGQVSTEFRPERYYRDAPLLLIGEGSNEIQQLIIARRLLERTA